MPVIIQTLLAALDPEPLEFASLVYRPVDRNELMQWFNLYRKYQGRIPLQGFAS